MIFGYVGHRVIRKITYLFYNVFLWNQYNNRPWGDGIFCCIVVIVVLGFVGKIDCVIEQGGSFFV